MPAYHSGKLSKTDRPDYNYPLRPTTPDLTLPFAPRNPMVTSPYSSGAWDIRWDNPKIIPQNSGLNIVGCNVYRATDSPYGPYQLVNDTPVTVPFFRDQTIEQQVTNENATATLKYNIEPDKRWLIYSRYRPIVIPGTNGQTSLRVQDIKVEIDDGDGTFLEIPAFSVNGVNGEIELISYPIYNEMVQQILPPRLPVPPNGRVRISYRYLAHSVLNALNQRIYYKVTTVAINPTSPSSFIETPLEEISARSGFDIEMIDYIWREAINRNRWILDQGGERVKVFIRKWMGIKCDNYQFNYGQSHNDCPTCFVPGTLINTDRGWRPIESINLGDSVLSSDGNYHQVKRTICRQYKGDILSILSSVNTNPLLVTPEHPLLVMRSNHTSCSKHGRKALCGPKCNSYIERGDGNARSPSVRLLPSGNWWARVQVNGSRGRGRVSLGTYETKEKAIEAINSYKKEHLSPMHVLEWDEAGNISKQDWLTPQWNSDIRDMNTIRIPEEFLGKGKYGPKRVGATEFIVDSEFLWVIGMYIAEGSHKEYKVGKSGGGSIIFSLHRDEKSFQKRLGSFFERYGYKPYFYSQKDKLSTVVVISSTTLSQWFPTWLGHLCYNKHIPQEFMYLPKDKIWSLVKGIHDGDGSKRDNEITQTSEILALQLVDILHRVGEQPLVRRQISNVLTPKGNRRRPAYCVGWAEDTLNRDSRKGRWVFGRNILSQVKNIKSIPYEGMVYNLEVEDDHSYIANGIVSHNCYGTNIVGGFSGPYDITIAPPETEKQIELMDMGLHMRYDWQSWLTDYPLINPRDFIVRQNNERYLIGPVNPQGQRGAIFQQHFTMSYIDTGDIRYKVPITGGETSVPASYDQYRQTAPTDASPVVNDKPEIPKERIIRGRTVIFENIQY